MSDKCIKIAKSQKYNFRQKISCKMSNWMSAFFFSAVVLNAGVTAWSEQRKDTCGLKPFLITPNLHNYKTLWNVQPTQTNPCTFIVQKGLWEFASTEVSAFRGFKLLGKQFPLPTEESEGTAFY